MSNYVQVIIMCVIYWAAGKEKDWNWMTMRMNHKPTRLIFTINSSSLIIKIESQVQSTSNQQHLWSSSSKNHIFLRLTGVVLYAVIGYPRGVPVLDIRTSLQVFHHLSLCSHSLITFPVAVVGVVWPVLYQLILYRVSRISTCWVPDSTVKWMFLKFLQQLW